MKYTKDYTLGGRAYPVRHYLVAIRLRTCNSTPDQSHEIGRAPHRVRHSMFAPSPQCGDTSGASLGVRSVALLHFIEW